MDADELAFAHAIARWRDRHGYRFPTVRQLLSILGELGYRKCGPQGPAPGDDEA
jgi:hypothetical protein